MMHAFVSGEVIRPPERRTAANGNAYVVALVRAGDAMVSVTAFDAELAERLGKLRKGDPVTVSGRLQVNAYLDKSGEPKAGVSVTATELMAAPARRVTA